MPSPAATTPKKENAATSPPGDRSPNASNARDNTVAVIAYINRVLEFRFIKSSSVSVVIYNPLSRATNECCTAV